MLWTIARPKKKNTKKLNSCPHPSVNSHAALAHSLENPPVMLSLQRMKL